VLTLGRVAISAAVFGAVAVSTQGIVNLLDAKPGVPPLGAIFDGVLEAGGSAFAVTFDVGGLFPFASLLADLAVVFGLTLTLWLYERYWLVAAALALASIAIWALADRVPDRESQHTLRQKLAWSAGGLLAVFAAGAVPATGLRLVAAGLGVAWLADLVGFVAALALGLWLLHWAWRTWQWSLMVAAPAGDGIDRAATVGRTAYAASAWLLAIAVPLVIVWAVAAVVTGSLGRVLAALVAAEPTVQAVIVVAVGSLAVGISRLVVDNWDDIQTAVLERGAVGRVRTALWLSGFPIGVAALLYVGLSAMAPLPVAAGIAFAFVWIAKWLAGLLSAARYRAALSEPREEFVANPVADVWVVEDAEGETQYVARVSRPQVVGRTDSAWLAHVDRPGFVDAVGTAVVDFADGEDARPLVADRYADRLLETGETDFEAVERAARDEARKVIFDALRNENGHPDVVSREWFDEKTDGLPDNIRADVLKRHSGDLGNISINEDVVELRNDPFRRGTWQRSGVKRVSSA